MAYITLDELKEILPGILDSWVDDEGDLEYIFQEIEQKCYVGTNKRKGKQWRKYIEDKVDQLNKKVEEMHRKHIDEGNSMSRELARICKKCGRFAKIGYLQKGDKK